jgi:hypothetical protein
MGINVADLSKLVGKNYESLQECLDDIWDEATQPLEEYRAANPRETNITMTHVGY